MKVLRSISAIFLAQLVLVSSTSFMVGIHRCGGTVRSIALFTEARACPMEQQTMTCHIAVQSSCCQDVKVVHEQEELNVSRDQHQVTAPTVLDVASAEVLVAVVIPLTEHVLSTPYHPPLRAIDRVVTHRALII